MVVNIIGGAIGSTQSAISNAAYLFATHPDQAELLRHDADLGRPAVEEVLRYAPPFRSTRRKALEPITIAGLSLEPGQAVLLSRQAANRDPARFPDPHRFDIRRGDANHASFGHGPHFCLGQALARANLAEAVPAFVRRCRDLELITEPARLPFDPVEKFDALKVRYRGSVAA
jgi:cytochrome P450